MASDLNALRAVMFSDVAGSSTLYKELGDQRARALVGQAVEMMCRAAEELGGIVIKTIGDATMSRFDQPERAVRAAIAIQQQSLEMGSDRPVAVRIGIAFGATVQDGTDLFGVTVNDAAYVAGIARGRQIVVTEALVQALGPEERARCQEFDHVALKGAKEGSTLYRLTWEQPGNAPAAATMMSPGNLLDSPAPTLLRLQCEDRSWTVSPDATPFRIGRDPDNTDLHVDVSHASRDHCHILCRRGRFLLSDHSTNGTYVEADGQQEVFLRREEIPLLGRGAISLGQPCSAAGTRLILYDLGE